MIKKSWIYLLLIVLAVSACVPSSPSKGRRSNNNSSTGSGSGSSGGDDSSSNESGNVNGPSGESLVWFSGGQEVSGTLTINEDIQTVVYIQGQDVHNFLSVNNNFSQQYCLVVSIDEASEAPNNRQQLRARAIPISFTNFQNNSIERLLRIDIADKVTNQAVCGGSTAFIDNNGILGSQLNGALSTQVTYSPSDICPTCTGLISSTHVDIYQVSSNSIADSTRVPANIFNLNGLGLRVDSQSNAIDPGSSCSNSSCKAQGFDCCLDGQCVNDGTQKPNAFNDPDFSQALADVASNPSNFVNWPNIYFVCSTPPVVSPTPTPFPDAQATSSSLFEQQKQEFFCLEGGKQDPQDFSTCSTSTDFAVDQAAYVTIRNDVWDRCGCEAQPFPTDPQSPECPDFGLKAIRDSNNEITAVVCDIPQPSVEPTPFQNTNVTVPVRSAPHRFYSESGQNFDDISVLTDVNPVVLQEGAPFSYLDESGKTDPQMEDFSMNAILGQMNVQLTRALPAKTIRLDLDQTYIISATSGFYTPCPQCANDSWFDAFSPFPSLSGGNGLQAVGHSTTRDAFSNNTQAGNYEDTIFGRACWVPPTMIPYTHKKNSDVQQQRLDRLSTQAAMYANGYQRDWFGFNKGALIGSFDGVTWFAIGNGRRVTATSTKLFLAINAPFADLAENTDLNVSVVTDLTGNDTVANFDFDPNLAINDPRQNKAGSCQFYHQCNVDSDCVTKLGWEYVCIDTSQFRTRWPKFDLDGNEEANDEISEATFNQILQGFQPTGVGPKRCVYRGGGSLCKRDFQTSLAPEKQKFFTCAPNFYCESVGGNNLNANVVREPNVVENIIFGQEANILGRPINYVGGQTSFSLKIRGNLEHNASIHSTNPGDFGLCRPGKRLSTPDPLDHHQNADTSRRTDYISQISSCNSQALGNPRIWSCPVFETNPNSPSNVAVGDYIPHNNTGLDIEIFNKRHLQNACGDESSRQVSLGAFDSTFANIEAEPLPSLFNLVNPTVVRDACMRRPGSVCHTDLDCSPNKLHETQAQFFGIEFFGNTSAEQKYWQESLVCGQAKPKPFLQADDFFEYDMTINRCCREVGKDITMYTQSNSLTVVPDLGTENLSLSVATYPLNGPAADGRYSRYVVSDARDEPAPGLRNDIYSQVPIVNQNLTPKKFQWKSINDSGKKTCCGGGWVRKFADGSTDWSNFSRLTLNYEAFSCLNYRNPIVFNRLGTVNNNNYLRDSDKFCLAPADGGCFQTEIPEANGFEVVNPSLDTIALATLDTTPLNDPIAGGVLEQALSSETPYQPIPYNNPVQISSQGPFNFFATRDFDDSTSFFLPNYIDPAMIQTVQIVYVKDEELSPAITMTRNDLQCNPFMNNPLSPGIGEETFCLINDITFAFQIFHARAAQNPDFGNPTLNTQFQEWDYAGVLINYFPFGSLNALAGDASRQRMRAGNELYYLTKLGRLELLGIPQIYYEPLYCNTDRSQLVPDLFTMPSQTRNAVGGQNGFEEGAFTYDPNINGIFMQNIYDSSAQNFDISNLAERVVFQDKVNHGQIFSGHEFKCCLELGSESDTASNCCSNHIGTQGTNPENVCMLPPKANLNVYFNKFVSGDGMGEDQLTDADFVPETGEPKLRQETYAKLAELGNQFCENGIRQGAAFGQFFGEPNNGFFQQNGDVEDGRINSIIDSNFDESDGTGSGELDGAVPYLSGFRWNHHFYCN